METASGSRLIHTTPSIAFQEEGLGTTVRNEEISIPKSKRRSIQLTEETDVVHIAIQPKKEPPYSGMNLDKPNPATDKMCSHLLVVQKSIKISYL